jgi:hypothetical protein
MKNPHFDSVNPHFKSKFASLGAVLSAVLPVLNKHGLALSQWPISNSAAAGCLTRLSHTSGEWMEEPFLIPVDKMNAHGFASAVTYSKRIAAQSVAGVVGDTDDDGNQAVGDNLEGKAKAPSASPAAIKEDAFDSLPTKMQAELRKFAADVTALVEEGREDDAWGLIEAQRMEVEEKLGLWHLLGSKIRAAIKKAGERADQERRAAERNKHQQSRPQGVVQ